MSNLIYSKRRREAGLHRICARCVMWCSTAYRIPRLPTLDLQYSKPLMVARVHRVHSFFHSLSIVRVIGLSWMCVQCFSVSSVYTRKHETIRDAFHQYAFFNDIDFYYCFHYCCHVSWHFFASLYPFTTSNSGRCTSIVFWVSMNGLYELIGSIWRKMSKPNPIAIFIQWNAHTRPLTPRDYGSTQIGRIKELNSPNLRTIYTVTLMLDWTIYREHDSIT